MGEAEPSPRRPFADSRDPIDRSLRVTVSKRTTSFSVHMLRAAVGRGHSEPAAVHLGTWRVPGLRQAEAEPRLAVVLMEARLVAELVDEV